VSHGAGKRAKRSQQITAAGDLLAAAADALNACHASGLDLRVKHGALQCEEGLILDLPDGTWVARTRLYTPFAPPSSDGLDD
jgi:hypothetical protein